MPKQKPIIQFDIGAFSKRVAQRGIGHAMAQLAYDLMLSTHDLFGGISHGKPENVDHRSCRKENRS